MDSMSGETDSSDEGFETRVKTQKVELWIDFKPDQMTGVFFQRQFKPFESQRAAIIPSRMRVMLKRSSFPCSF